MAKEHIMIQMEILFMKVILLMINLKEMGKVIGKMVNIILDNGKMAQQMVKEKIIIKMEILNMKVILLMIKQKEMENIIGKMVYIILDNIKMV